MAARLGFCYVDSGALYRAIAVAAGSPAAADPASPAFAAAIESIPLRLEPAADRFRILLDGRELGAELRTPEVSRRASQLAVHGVVRAQVGRLLREAARIGPLVVEGRDIGTVVFPRATLKVFLLAGVAERARRRRLDLLRQGIDQPEEQVARDLEERDRRDSTRSDAPLREAEGALCLDTGMLHGRRAGGVDPGGVSPNGGREGRRLFRGRRPRRGGLRWPGNPRGACTIGGPRPRSAPRPGSSWVTARRGWKTFRAKEGSCSPPATSPTSIRWLSAPLFPASCATSPNGSFSPTRSSAGSFARTARCRWSAPAPTGARSRWPSRSSSEGEGLIVFPEGTRIRRPGVGEAKPGIGMLAVRSGVPVIPCWAGSTWDPRRSLLRRVPVHVRFGPPLVFAAPAGRRRRVAAYEMRPRDHGGHRDARDGRSDDR